MSGAADLAERAEAARARVFCAATGGAICANPKCVAALLARGKRWGCPRSTLFPNGWK